MEHMFFDYLLAQQVWHYVTNIFWQLFAKWGNLGLHKSFSMMQCLFDQPTQQFSKTFNRIWFFLRSNLPRIIWRQRNDLVFNASQRPLEKIHQMVWDSLINYLTTGDWSANILLMLWKKLQMLPMRMFLTNLTRYGVLKVLLLFVAICQLLEKLDLMWALFLESPLFCAGSPKVTCYFPLQLNFFDNLCQKHKKDEILNWTELVVL